MFFAVAENESIGRVKFSCLQASTARARPQRTQQQPRSLPPPAPFPQIYVDTPVRAKRAPPSRVAENDSAVRAATTEGRGLSLLLSAETRVSRGALVCVSSACRRRVSPPRITAVFRGGRNQNALA
jgi:hypothetical protein